MKALILPGKYNKDLELLTELTPNQLLPIVNKPVVEHIIELLVQHNIKDIVLVLEHMPYETEQYFKNGERWGVNLSYSIEQKNKGLKSTLERIGTNFTEPFLCIYDNSITNLNLSDFVKFSNKSKADLTVLKRHDQDDVDYNSYPFIMTPNMLSLLINSKGLTNNITRLLISKPETEFISNVYDTTYNIGIISSLDDYLKINREILNGKFNGIIIPGKQQEPGIWIGRHTRIDEQAKLTPPVIVGNYCNIGAGTEIINGTIIGNNVLVEKNSFMDKSIIFSDSYIGSQTEIKESIVVKKYLINVPRKISSFVTDDFIIGNLAKTSVSSQSSRSGAILAASLLLAISSPVIIALLIYHSLFPSKKLLRKEHINGNYEIKDHNGILEPTIFCLYHFQTDSLFIKKLPGLLNVIKGDMNLVGNSPLTNRETETLDKEWQSLHANAPVGLFHIWETEPDEQLSLEEKIVMENYYSATRSYSGDMKIVLKTILKLRKCN